MSGAGRALLMLEFERADRLLAALPALRGRGLVPLEAYTPFSVEGLAEALGHGPSRVRPVMLAAGLAGALAAFGLQAWSAGLAYPINSGGRPLFSWPAFVPVTFEFMVLCAALAGFLALLALCGLPRLNHRVFEVPDFTRASHDRFFLEVRLEAEPAERAALYAELAELGVAAVREPPR